MVLHTRFNVTLVSDDGNRGRAGSDQELAIITSQLRRRICSATIRANYHSC